MELKMILNKENLKLTKEGTIILNSARAQLCDLNTIKELCQKDKIFFWLDDLDAKEQREKLIGIQNVLTTPHLGWMTKESQKDLMKSLLKM